MSQINQLNEASEFIPQVACVQMVSGVSVAHNLSSAAQGIAQAVAQGAHIVVLPEYFCLMGQKDTDKCAVAESFAEQPDAKAQPIQRFLRDQAVKHRIYLVGGTIPLKSPDPAKVYNTLLIYSPEGEVVARYDKIHLFGFQNGAERYNEGDSIVAGDLTHSNAPAVWQSPWGAIGLSICYDVRFPELYRMAGHVLAWICVAAFTHTTGQAHWEILLRARAIENQCYLIACGQGGLHENGRRTFGHSMVIDPWGVIQAVIDEGEGVIVTNLLKSRIDRVRTSLPALQHRVLACQ